MITKLRKKEGRVNYKDLKDVNHLQNVAKENLHTATNNQRSKRCVNHLQMYILNVILAGLYRHELC